MQHISSRLKTPGYILSALEEALIEATETLGLAVFASDKITQFGRSAVSAANNSVNTHERTAQISMNKSR